MEELDQVLDREDVLVTGVVDEIDHRCERGRLAGPVGPVTSTKPRGRLVNPSIAGGNPGLASFGISWGIARSAALQRGTLEVGVDPEARSARDGVGEIDLPVGLEPLTLIVVQDQVDDLAGDLQCSSGG